MVFNRLFRRRAEPDIKLEQGLEKTRCGVFSEITKLFDRAVLDDDLYEELEMLLIQADVGWDISQRLVEELKTRVREERIIEPSLARDVLRFEMIELLELATRNRRVKILQRGVPSSFDTAKAMPPFDVPSSLAIMMSVMSTDFANSLA